jgi:hypothetical protein
LLDIAVFFLSAVVMVLMHVRLLRLEWMTSVIELTGCAHECATCHDRREWRWDAVTRMNGSLSSFPPFGIE